jgi:hypothetical protein
MSKALEGENYCLLHQGDHSHYATHNCRVCSLEKQVVELTTVVSSMKQAATISIPQEIEIESVPKVQCTLCSAEHIGESDQSADAFREQLISEGWGKVECESEIYICCTSCMREMPLN